LLFKTSSSKGATQQDVFTSRLLGVTRQKPSQSQRKYLDRKSHTINDLLDDTFLIALESLNISNKDEIFNLSKENFRTKLDAIKELEGPEIRIRFINSVLEKEKEVIEERVKAFEDQLVLIKERELASIAAPAECKSSLDNIQNINAGRIKSGRLKKEITSKNEICEIQAEIVPLPKPNSEVPELIEKGYEKIKKIVNLRNEIENWLAESTNEPVAELIGGRYILPPILNFKGQNNDYLGNMLLM
jgi:hypothetical protein